MTPDDGYKTPYSAPIPVLPGVHYARTFLPQWKKKRGKPQKKRSFHCLKDRKPYKTGR
jgi:hypothetical protein